MIKAFWMDEDGLTTVEYALLLALLVVAGIGAWTGFGGKVKSAVNSAGTSIGTATTS